MQPETEASSAVPGTPISTLEAEQPEETSSSSKKKKKKGKKNKKDAAEEVPASDEVPSILEDAATEATPVAEEEPVPEKAIHAEETQTIGEPTQSVDTAVSPDDAATESLSGTGEATRGSDRVEKTGADAPSTEDVTDVPLETQADLQERSKELPVSDAPNPEEVAPIAAGSISEPCVILPPQSTWNFAW